MRDSCRRMPASTSPNCERVSHRSPDIDQEEKSERHVVIDLAFHDLVAADGEPRQRRDAVLAAHVRPAAREPLDHVRSGERAERDEHGRRDALTQDHQDVHDQSHEQPDRHRHRQQREDRRDAELCGQQGATVAGHAEEQRLAKAQDSGIAPNQIEGQRQQPEDEHARREQDPKLVDQQGQDEKRAEQQRLDPEDHSALLSGGETGRGWKPHDAMLGAPLTRIRRA